MAITKIQSESLNLADDYAFTGTITGAGGINTPAFSARRENTGQSLANQTTVVATYEIEDFDTNNAFDPSTGVYTVPETGRYFFASSFMTDGSWTGGFLDWNLQNTTRTGASENLYAGYRNTSYNSRVLGSVSWIANCSANDEIKNFVYQDTGGTKSIVVSWFGGFKIIE